ncbi:glycosyltransferase [Allorhodopirellula solitaria]|uniref:Glycosyl transferase family 2 n=1 Tax=Allorhodopirellula solitaria TaxID=2527987 RepID=A0A5C5XU28_9BACT|nr:glycosyltransferase [Allorhodopirellula solitaria]TWT66410.1 Glycosyl transferase family 2 [Allorhodopirellula solitaria]
MSVNPPTIDVVILTRCDGDLPDAVLESLRRQRGVRVRWQQLVGAPRSDDAHRIATIARARNEGIARAQGDWVMFLDDDVILAPDCIARLHHALMTRPDFAAVAADYLGDRARHGSSPHVAMGATLFRRTTLQRIPFRWTVNKCECLCCCEDIRRAGGRIEYLSDARARHLAKPEKSDRCRSPLPADDAATSSGESASVNAKILVAFNRRDVQRFRDVFLRMLRASGNEQEVIAVGYGLYPSEQRLLATCQNLRLIHRVSNGQMPPVRRLTDFAQITAALPPGQSVAYWDASDVVIQANLDPLWQLTQEYPDRILAVREPLGYPHNGAIVGWTHSIQDPTMRKRAFELFSNHPFLNSGFSAGTAAAMQRYFEEAARMRSSAELRGTTDWGDQAAFNLYCHSDPERWQEVAQGWNYCVHDRPIGEVQVSPNGQITCRSGTPVYAAHGNARSLAQLAIVP